MCTPMVLDQPVDLAGRDAVDLGLLDDRDQRLLSPPARLEKAREIRALAQLGDPQLELARTRPPRALAVPVALRHPIAADLTQPGADLPRDLGLHDLSHQ